MPALGLSRPGAACPAQFCVPAPTKENGGCAAAAALRQQQALPFPVLFDRARMYWLLVGGLVPA